MCLDLVTASQDTGSMEVLSPASNARGAEILSPVSGELVVQENVTLDSFTLSTDTGASQPLSADCAGSPLANQSENQEVNLLLICQILENDIDNNAEPALDESGIQKNRSCSFAAHLPTQHLNSMR